MTQARDLADLAGAATGGGLTGRSMLINGAFQIWQRGTSAITVSGDDDFTADRFLGWANGGGTFTVEQSTDVPNNEFEFSAKLTNTATDGSVAAGDNYRWATDIEGYNVSPLAYGSSDAKTATLSFWVKSSLAGTYCGAFYSTTASRHYIYEYEIDTANTWEYKTVTISGDTTGSWNRTNGNGLRIYWGFGSGTTYQGTADAWAAGEKWETTNQAAWIGSSSATFFIAGVKLEIGETATPFDHEDYGTTLAKCQRYYFKIIADTASDSFCTGHCDSTGGTSANGTVAFPVTMRDSPTAIETSGTAGDYQIRHKGTSRTCSSIPTYIRATKDTGYVQFAGVSSLVAGDACTLRTATTSGYLAWSSEL